MISILFILLKCYHFSCFKVEQLGQFNLGLCVQIETLSLFVGKLLLISVFRKNLIILL